ncbi:hypothetical protein GCM10007973_20870 [Polymorphobacter multimanifer]|uniref:DUF1475 domain-containing protein n=1 Tax=Polymorphobacter multimanifer TaxID=1070431 RepID=A0A841L534_9SPHN|nr:hypothetical protein [Polymorphobacter multimanifer]MBB6227989.1 hypothetical protein [Polymorphobacter multimanifer]GGI84155.1 hypothetical protein GCM10007973_20870 [Polymorphobacter multimanifer]
MTLFRLFLIGFLAVLVAYTAMVIGNHGLNLLPVFFGDMASLAWPGQFNLDFFGYLLLSAIWVAWRHHFTPAGLGLAALASVGGMLFLSIYLLIVSAQARGDIRAILLGARRARP